MTRLFGLRLAVAVGVLALGMGAAAQGAGERYKGRTPASMLKPEQAGILLMETREQLEQPDRTLDFMGLQDGDVVADIGCGNGYYTLRVAERVAPHGLVLAVDVQPGMLDQLDARIEEHGVTNVHSILGEYDDPLLPPGTVDWILLVDAYHEFSDPAAMLARMKEALAPGGRVCLLEYRLEQDPATIPSPIPDAHKMSIEQVLKEWEPAGFELVQLAEFLPAQHLFVFKAADDPERPEVRKVTLGTLSNPSTFGQTVYFSGQPSPEDIAHFKELGISTVINLRTEREVEGLGFDEGALVRDAGMRYVHAPMGGALPTGEAWERIQAELDAADAGPVVLHCGSSNRVGAVWALYAGTEQGLDRDAAIAEGLAAGLRSPALKRQLEETLPE